MLSTRFPELKSKEACPACGEHKLYTNDSEKDDSVVRWHCLNCNHTFSEDENQKKFRQQQEKDGKEKKAENSYGITIIAFMLITILAILMSQQQEAAQDNLQPVNQVEQSN